MENRSEGDSGAEDWDGCPTKGDLGDMFTYFGNKLSLDGNSVSLTGFVKEVSIGFVTGSWRKNNYTTLNWESA